MTATTLQDIELELIKPHPANVRRDVGNVTELAASIKAQGLLEPLIVAASELDNTYTLIAGHRRLAAATKAKLKVVPCLVHDAMSDAEALELMLVENLQRVDLSPVEEGAAYQTLLQIDGIDVEHIRKRTGRAASTIRKRVGLMKLPESTLDKVHGGEISLADAAALAEFADDPAVVDHLSTYIGTSNWSYYLTGARRRRKDMAAAEEAGAEVFTSKNDLLAAHPVFDPLGWSAKPAPGLALLASPRETYCSVWGPPPEQTEDDDTTADKTATGHQVPQGNPNAGGSMVEKRKAAEAAAEQEAAKQVAQLAAATRLEFLRNILKEKRLRPGALVNSFRSVYWLILEGDEYLGAEVLDILGVATADGASWMSPDEAAERGGPALADLDLDKLAFTMTAAAMYAHSRSAILAAAGIRDMYGLTVEDVRGGVEYFDFLISLGYELSDVDQAQLTTLEERIAEFGKSEEGDDA